MSTTKVLLWEMPVSFWQIVLWDGESTYWTEEMRPSRGYLDPKFIGQRCRVTNSRFTYIGEL